VLLITLPHPATRYACRTQPDFPCIQVTLAHPGDDTAQRLGVSDRLVPSRSAGGTHRLTALSNPAPASHLPPPCPFPRPTMPGAGAVLFVRNNQSYETIPLPMCLCNSQTVLAFELRPFVYRQDYAVLIRRSAPGIWLGFPRVRVSDGLSRDHS
jgi:hypothetical protein